MLELVHEKKLINSDLVTRYTNGFYHVYLIEEIDELVVRVLKEDFKMPTIDFTQYNLGTINVAATGSMSSTDFTKHLKNLLIAQETLNDIELLVKNYKFEK